MRTAARFPVAGLAATTASTPTPPHLSILQVDVSLLPRNTPVSPRIWFMLSNTTYVTRSMSEKLVDAPQGYQTPIFLLDAILLRRGTQLRTWWLL